MTIRAIGGILLGMRGPSIFLALSLLSSPALRAEDPPAPERRPWEVSLQGRGGASISVDPVVLRLADPEVMSGLVGQLRAQGVRGLPAGQDDFSRQLFQSPVFAGGAKTFVVQNGQFVGISIAHEGKTYFFKPGESFAVEAGGKTALVVQPGAGVVSKKIEELKPDQQRAVQAGLGRLAGFRAPTGGLRFDGAQEGAAVQVRRPTATQPAGAAPAFVAAQRPASGNLVLANEYKGPIPKELKAGQFYWDAKLLKVVESVDGGTPKARTVGYMAEMRDAKGGDMVFWHGGAEPDKNGAHPHAAKNWSLWYLPKVDTDQYHIEGGKNTAKFVANYNMLDTRGATKIQTPEGPRLQLWTAMKSLPVYKKLPPLETPKDAAAAKAAAPEDRLLFRYGAPVGKKDHPMQSYVDMEGGLYQEQERAGKKYIVRAGQLFNIKPIPSPSDRPAFVAPASPQENTVKADPVGDLMGVLRSERLGPERAKAIEAAMKAVRDGDFEVYKAARETLGAYAVGKGLSPGGRIEAARTLLGLFPDDGAAAVSIVGALHQVIVPQGMTVPDYIANAAKRFDDKGVTPELAAEFTAFRSKTETNPGSWAGLHLLSPLPYQNPDPATNEALKLLAGLKLKDSRGNYLSDAVVARRDALQSALAHQDPGVRMTAATALGELGDTSRRARHMLAAIAVLDINPSVRVAAAGALPKVDPSGHYEALLPPPPAAAPVAGPARPPVYGPAPAVPAAGPEAAPKTSRLAGVLAMPNSNARGEAVNAHMQYLAGLVRDYPQAEELAAARADLRRLCSDEKGALPARGEAASLLMMLSQGSSDRAALRTLVQIAGPGAEARVVDPSLRAGAIRSLALASDPRDFDVSSRLTAIGKDKSEDAQVRFAAFFALYFQTPPAGQQKFAADFLAANPELKQMMQQAPAPANPFAPFTGRQRDPFSQFLQPR